MNDQSFLSRLARADDDRLRQQAEAEDAKGSPVNAAALWRALAERGDPEACFVLGERYDQGRGVIQNVVEAADWFRKAADQGLARAQSKLGEIYFHGRAAPGTVAGATETGGAFKAPGRAAEPLSWWPFRAAGHA